MNIWVLGLSFLVTVGRGAMLSDHTLSIEINSPVGDIT